ncbi:hypothetical protein NQ315_002857 [Exocentrus adspersus]|uniref:Transposable element P transposase-like RNase H C-terminal domain-containing protein n=1 Tax=Exocentrus adspersus TaxID=1586481 RepID=A0AAV8V8V3_9CUCU|nr:hypothetical protein NQ315_002857 [Exocentrus adspersus]
MRKIVWQNGSTLNSSICWMSNFLIESATNSLINMLSPKKINKMKVKCCTQVFSNQVGALMKAVLSWNSQVQLDSGAIDTANLILLNSSRKTGPPGKPLKGGVQNDSVHIQFWYDAIKILESMKFYCTENSRFVKVPSILNLIRTLKGFIYLSKKQDALENLFGCIRNYSGQESNPGAAHFISSFRALLVNNFMSTHSPNSNCQEDYHTGALDNLRSFITGEVLPGVTPLPDYEEPEVPSTVTLHRRSKVSRCTATYISGFIARKLLRKTKCENCKSNLLFRDNNNDTDFIKARQYDHCKLIKPGTVFTFLVSQSIARLFYLIPRLSFTKYF